MHLKQRINQIEKQFYRGAVDVTTLSDEELAQIHLDFAAQFPKQAKALDDVIQTLTDDELDFLRHGKLSLLSAETRQKLIKSQLNARER